MPPHRIASCVFAVVAVILAPNSSSAGVIVGYSLGSSQVYDIYTAGYVPNPTTLVRHASGAFVGAGLNLTDIGFVNPNTDRMITMISPRHFVMAAHAGPPTSTAYFVNSANQVRAYTIEATQALTTGTFNGSAVNLPSDLLVGRLTAPIPVGDGIGFYPIAFDPSANYAAAQNVSQLNAFMGQNTSGFQVTLAPAPEPSSLLLLSPVAGLTVRRRTGA